MMNTNLFTVFALTLTCALTYFYAEVREFYTPIKAYQSKVRVLSETIQKERVAHLHTSYDFHEFRTHVATLLPTAIRQKGEGEVSYPLRQLASVTQKNPNEHVNQLRAEKIMNEGNRYFRNKQFDKAATQFEMILQRHPYSAQVVRAMMLLVECHFNLGNHDQVLYHATRMIDVYPEDEHTGYAMIRLAKVYEQKDRHGDAIDIYKTVMLTFKDPNLIQISQSGLRAVEL